ncbi:hypothetical protein Lser_V15G37676 [Lactuca serriola]
MRRMDYIYYMASVKEVNKPQEFIQPRCYRKGSHG